MTALSESVTVVTGGASGIGEATARLLVARGGNVVIGDIQDERGQAVTAQLGEAALYQHADVTQEDDVAALVDTAMQRWGRLDGMFNNAGIVGAVGPIEATSTAHWRFTMEVLQDSVFYGMKHAARVMKPLRSGSIVSTSSIAGVMGGLGSHAYSAAKTAVVGLTRSVAAELGAYGIRVNAVAPGRIATALVASLKTGDPDDLDETTRILIEQSPLAGRAGAAQDIASAVGWLLSDEAAYVSGQTIVVDGGVTSGSPPAHLAASHRFAAPGPLIAEAGRRVP